MVDDYAGNTSTTGTVSVGGARNGTIETAGDTDWFAITLQAGYTYTFDMLGLDSGNGTLADPYMRIRDSSGNSLALDDDSGTGLNARISGFTATYSGTYYISAGSSTASGTGTYRVTATQTGTPTTTPSDDYSNNMLTSGRLSVSSPATGQVEIGGDVDWFRASLSASGSYTIDVLAFATGDGTLADPYVQILDAQGNIVAANNDGGTDRNARIVNFTPDSTGDYFIVVSSFSATDVGTYSVEITESHAPVVTPTPVVSNNEHIVRLPLNGPITTFFGAHTWIGGGTGAYSVDVAGARYDDVIAGVSGVVIYVASGHAELELTEDPNSSYVAVLGNRQNSGFGNTVVIQTEGGLFVSYSHLTDASVQRWVTALAAGDTNALQVTAGNTVIGQLGQNGAMESDWGTPWHSHVQIGMGLFTYQYE